MRAKLASVSAITLGLVLSAPAYAQDATTPLPEGEAGVEATTPGVAQDMPDEEAPAVATDPATDMIEPPVASDPAAEPIEPDVATDPALEPDTPDVATDPAIEPDTPDVATDPAIEPGAPDVATDPSADPAEPGLAQQRIGFEDLDTVLGDIGIEDRELFFGSIVRGETEDGHRVAMLFGPEGFQPGEGDAAPVAEFTELHGQLGDAGFQNVREDIDWLVMQGTLDGHTVFATGIDPAAHHAMDAEAAEGDFDREALREALSDAGIEDAEEVEAKLFRASSDGRTIFLLVGPEGFEAGGSVELSEDELIERFEEAGLSDVEAIDDDVHLVRGQHDDGAVLALAGGPLGDRGAAAAN
jgi:hypothetical protein